MLARKTRITVIALIIAIVVLIIVGTVVFLYLKTDAFKSSEELFSKYLKDAFESVNIAKIEDTLGIENTIETSKYTSDLEGKIEYTTNVGTDSEDKKSSINQVELKVKGNIDNANNYKYQNITIGKDDETYVGLEYLKEDAQYGVRLAGVQQYVSNNDDKNNILTELGLQNFSAIISDVDVNDIISFSDQEKQTLANTYSGVIMANVSKNKYKKEKVVVPTDNGNVKTNSYYISMTLPEYNALYVKILEKVKSDQIILSKIDKLENAIKTKYPDYNETETLKSKFTKKIDEKIKEIQNNNVGNDAVKVAVYENNRNTVRVYAKTPSRETTVDISKNKSIKITLADIGNDTKTKTIKISKNNSSTENDLSAEYESKENEDVLKNIKVTFKQALESDKINRNLVIDIVKQKYEGIFTANEDIETVDNFKNKQTLSKDTIKLSDLQDEQLQLVKAALKDNVDKQFSNLYAVASSTDYKKMLQNLGVIEEDAVKIGKEGQVTETERNRFNAQFEFFVSSDLTTSNIEEMLGTAKNNLEDVKVLLNDGTVEDLDTDKLAAGSKDASNYKNSISEVLIYLKRDSTNDKKLTDITDYIKKAGNKYTVTIEYDENGLAKIIRAKIQRKS